MKIITVTDEQHETLVTALSQFESSSWRDSENWALSEISDELHAAVDVHPDTATLDAIHSLLSGHSWSPDTLEWIAGHVVKSGREVLPIA